MAEACQHGYQEASLRGFISDGSHWIRGIAELHFPEAVHILDWYHLAENLSKVRQRSFRRGDEGKPAVGRANA